MRTYIAIVRALRASPTVGIPERISLCRQLRLRWNDPMPEPFDCTLGEAIEEWVLQQALAEDMCASLESIDIHKLIKLLVDVAPVLIEVLKLLLVLVRKNR